MSTTISPMAAREGAALDRTEAAKALDLNERTLRRYEGGDREPGAGLLVRMAELYGLGAQGALKLGRWFGENKARS